MKSRGNLGWMGVAAVLFYGVHGAWHLAHHEPQDLLWACHVACLLVGIGCLTGRPLPIAIGVLWLSFGVPLWLLDLATGGTLLPTSPLTHVGGLVLGILATRRLGWPRPSWWKAMVLLLVLLGICRLVTPPAANVNLAFSVSPGWEKWFPSYLAYLGSLSVICGVAFLAVEGAARRLVAR